MSPLKEKHIFLFKIKKESKEVHEYVNGSIILTMETENKSKSQWRAGQRPLFLLPPGTLLGTTVKGTNRRLSQRQKTEGTGSTGDNKIFRHCGVNGMWAG